MTELRPSDSVYDLLLGVDDEHGSGSNVLKLTLVRDGKPAFYPAVSEPADRSERIVQFENRSKCAGFSRASEESTGGIAYGVNIDDTNDGVIIPAGEITTMSLDPATAGGYVRDAFEIDGTLYLLMDRSYIFRWPGKAGTTIDIADYLGLNITTQYGLVYNGLAYITSGGSGLGIAAFNGSSHTVAGAGVQRLQMAKVYWTISSALATGGLAGTAGLGDWFMVSLSTDGKNFLLCAGDPMVAGNWSASYPVGDSTYAAQRLVWSNRYVAVARPDGVYTIDELGYTPNLTPWVEKVYHGDNGSSVEYWNGAIWYATKLGLAWVPLTGERQDSPIWVQFGDGRSNETPIYGFPRCMAPGHDRLWVGMYNGNDGYIMAVRLGPDGRPRWHGAFQKLEGKIPTYIREVTTSAGQRWLLVGAHNGTNPSVTIQSLPQSGQGLVDYKQGTTHRFSTAWSTYYPITNFSSWSKKTGRRAAIVAGLLGAGNSLAVKTACDDDIDTETYTTQGTASTPPRSTFTFTGDVAEGVDFSFRVDGVNSNTVPIALRSLEVRATAHPETAYTYVARVKVAKNQSRRFQTIDDDSSPAVTLGQIKAFESRGPLGMIDPIGRYCPAVKIEAGTQPIMREDTVTKQWYAEVQLTITILQTGYVYDEDAYFDQIGEYI